MIYIEGEQAPAEDFAALSKGALKDVLTEALGGEHRELRMSLKWIEVLNDVEEDEGSDSNGEERFDF